jgi:hypothetical protein
MAACSSGRKISRAAAAAVRTRLRLDGPMEIAYMRTKRPTRPAKSSQRPRWEPERETNPTARRPGHCEQGVLRRRACPTRFRRPRAFLQNEPNAPLPGSTRQSTWPSLVTNAACKTNPTHAAANAASGRSVCPVFCIVCGLGYPWRTAAAGRVLLPGRHPWSGPWDEKCETNPSALVQNAGAARSVCAGFPCRLPVRSSAPDTGRKSHFPLDLSPLGRARAFTWTRGSSPRATKNRISPRSARRC